MADALFQILCGPPEERDPIQAVRRQARAAPPKRFYDRVDVVADDGGFAVMLDGRVARTPRREALALPARAAAAAIAAEWTAQGDTLDPAAMLLTRLANSAIDGVAQRIGPVQAEIVEYAGSDLICYRAAEPPVLVAAQDAAWNPVLAWASDRLGAPFVLSQGVVHVAQPAAAMLAARAAVAPFLDPFALACLHAMTTLTGSALLALAVAHGEMPVAAAWAAAHADEDFQIQAWGADEEASRRRAARGREMAAAARLLALLA